MLDKLPLEILNQIQQLLPRKDTHQISITSKYLYSAITPSLYTHLELGYLTHIRQLQQGVQNNPFLRKVILQNTKHLTLRSKQNGNRWRVQDLLRIVGTQTKIELLTFCDCAAITTSSIHEIVSILPHVTHVEFKYCHIIYASTIQPSTSRSVTYLGTIKGSLHHKNRVATSFEYPVDHNNKPSALNNPLLQRVSYVWTDFTEKSIVPSLFSQITHLELGSNRNKYESVNGIMVREIPRYCPDVTHLTIALPALPQEILCYTIAAYGNQLKHLSIRCDGSQTLLAVATHAMKLQSLFVRITPAAKQDDMNSSLLCVIENCLDLQKMQVTSRQLDDDIPNIIWESIIACASGKDNGNISRAKNMLLMKLQKQLEGEDLKSSLQQSPSSFQNSSDWFYSITKEALEQRYIYNNSLQGNLGQQSNTIEGLFMDTTELNQVKRRLLDVKSTRNDMTITE